MGRLSTDTIAGNRHAIHAAMDQLLRGDIPPGAKCDLKALAALAGVTRTGFYPKGERPGPYQALAEQFQRRLQQLQQTGAIPDPRAAQIARLKHDNTKLTAQITAHTATIAELTAFKTLAISRLAAQHNEIARLRTPPTNPTNLRRLPSRNANGLIGPC